MFAVQKTLVGLILLLLAGGTPLTGESFQQTGDSAQESDAARLLAHIRAAVESGKWQTVEDSMTAEAWDAWSAQLVVECITLANVDLEFGITGIEESQEKILEALEKHGLDKIEIAFPTIEIRSGGDLDEEDADDNDDDKRAGREKQRQEVLKQISKGDKRREIVADLWAAKASSPLSVSFLTGKIEHETAAHDAITVKIAPAKSRPPSDDGFAIVIAVPPVFVDLVKVDDQWKFSGINEEKTEEARKNFRPGGKSDF